MNSTYVELSEELLRRILNKSNELINRDRSLSNTYSVVRNNFIYPNNYIGSTSLENIHIESNTSTLSGYEYTGNKGGYITLPSQSSNNKYIYSPYIGKINVIEPISKEHIVLNEFARSTGSTIDYKYIRNGQANTLLPSLVTWDVSTSGNIYISNTKPKDVYLFPSNAMNWETVWCMGINEMTHPFHPKLLFTGLVICVGQYRNIMYEYTDMEGIFGNLYGLYISSLKPLDLAYPLGFPSEGMLIRDPCYRDLIGEYPKEGLIDKDLGGYTGLTTSPSYHPIHKFYLYVRSNYSLFLSSRVPYKGIKEQVLSYRESQGLVRDPYVLSNPSLPAINVITDNQKKQYQFECKLHEL